MESVLRGVPGAPPGPTDGGTRERLGGRCEGCFVGPQAGGCLVWVWQAVCPPGELVSRPISVARLACMGMQGAQDSCRSF